MSSIQFRNVVADFAVTMSVEDAMVIERTVQPDGAIELACPICQVPMIGTFNDADEAINALFSHIFAIHEDIEIAGYCASMGLNFPALKGVAVMANIVRAPIPAPIQEVVAPEPEKVVEAPLPETPKPRRGRKSKDEKEALTHAYEVVANLPDMLNEILGKKQTDDQRRARKEEAAVASYQDVNLKLTMIANTEMVLEKLRGLNVTNPVWGSPRIYWSKANDAKVVDALALIKLDVYQAQMTEQYSLGQIVAEHEANVRKAEQDRINGLINKRNDENNAALAAKVNKWLEQQTTLHFYLMTGRANVNTSKGPMHFLLDANWRANSEIKVADTNAQAEGDRLSPEDRSAIIREVAEDMLKRYGLKRSMEISLKVRVLVPSVVGDGNLTEKAVTISHTAETPFEQWIDMLAQQIEGLRKEFIRYGKSKTAAELMDDPKVCKAYGIVNDAPIAENISSVYKGGDGKRKSRKVEEETAIGAAFRKAMLEAANVEETA